MGIEEEKSDAIQTGKVSMKIRDCQYKLGRFL